MPGNVLNITLPVVGVTEGTDYATQINAALNTIITDIEAKITPDEIDINTNLSFASGATNYGITDVALIALASQSSTLAGSNPRTVYSTGGELYFQDASGNNVQLTSSGSVNNAGAGSINSTGSPAYGSSGVEVLWSGTDSEFRFKDGSGANDLADLVFGNLEMGNGANRTTITSTVTTDYTITLPATAAASNNSVLEISTGGALSFVKTLALTALTTTGDITASGDVTADHLYHTGTEDHHFPATAFIPLDTSSFLSNSSNSVLMYWGDTAGGTLGPLLLGLENFLPGTVVSRVELYYFDTRATGSNWTMEIISNVTNTGTITVEDSETWVPSGGSASVPAEHAWTVSGVTTAQDTIYFLKVTPQAGSSTFVQGVFSAIITVTRPS